MTGDHVDSREVAYELLVELLAHQFAFPVQWIETQDRLLSGKDAVNRFIEFGPSKALVGMGQKTLKQKASRGEGAVVPNTEFLASTQNLKELCYEYDVDVHVEEEAPAAPPSALAALDPLAEPRNPPTLPTAPAPVMSVVIEDVPLSVELVMRALIARKTKKSVAEIPPHKSIKEFCGGKSTLQNELVGDFDSEFANIPDRPEDVALKDWPANGDITLGKTSLGLVAKLVSSRMPAKFGTDSIRKYLASKWGLGPSRQGAVLLFGLASEPPSRLPSTTAAEEYWDEVAQTYAASAGITLQIQVLNDTANPTAAATAAFDPSILAELSKANNRMYQQQLNTLAEYLKVDLNPTLQTETESLASELQQKLDAITSEFSEEFLAGVAPAFSAQKSRRYSDWWNTARQDLLAFYDVPMLEETVGDNTALDTFIHRMENRAHEELAAMARTKIRQAWTMRLAAPKMLAAAERVELAIASAVSRPPLALVALPAMGPRVTVTEAGSIQYTEIARPGVSGLTAYVQFLSNNTLHGQNDKAPFVSIQSGDGGILGFDQSLTERLHQRSAEALESGFSLNGKNILVTGVGPNSIGAEVVRILLMAGAHVLATTSREPHATAKYYQSLYEEHGAKGSELTLMQFNQASAADCERLIDHIYEANGLDTDLDAILPFAAAPEPGTEVQDISAKNELVHRLMLANVMRLLGRIIHNKRDRSIDCHPTQVLLPLSPNHGTFGGDGLYSETKLGLESLLNRAESESWSDELCMCGVKIGWTRGTGLMNANDMVAESIERSGVLTFSVREMAFNIVMLMTQEFAEACENTSILADFGGGLSALKDSAGVMSRARKELQQAADIAKALKAEEDREAEFMARNKPALLSNGTADLGKKSMLKVGFPKLPDYHGELLPLEHLRGMNDPSDTVVVVGFAELGPWGSARLRWEIECRGKLSRAAYTECAWMMGLIKHVDGPSAKGHYVGWVDAKSGDAIVEADIESRYGKHIADHTGIRIVESEGAGYDPKKKEFLEEIAIEEDLPEFETSPAAANALKLKHGDYVAIRRTHDGAETCQVRIKRGATIMVPKAVPFDWGSVAGQLPTGWNPQTYGIPQDLVHQLDPATLYTVCCVAEAFYSAGIADPLEVFQHIHLSEMGNFIGSSMGGALKTRNLYKDTYLDRPVHADALQDTYLNTTAAWINMLLLGAAGPIKTPVGACATGVESVDDAVESIRGGKTKMCIVGGFDDLQEDEAYGFSKMKATVNVAEELKKGRLPSEMSRPTAESRAGFVESQGAGVQILCRGDIALEMGLPVYGVIAASTMAADKIGRSVPAPGQGILTFAKETRNASISRLLDLEQRDARAMQRCSSTRSTSSSGETLSDMTELWSEASSTMDITPATAPSTPFGTPGPSLPLYNDRDLGLSKMRAAPGPTLSPLRAGLATWGLTIDDLDFASLHGTSTKANDINEPDVLCKQMAHLGRDQGLPLWAICQKSITGHPKAPAAAWMLNGCLQVLDSNEVPGNRNADNIDPALRSSKYLCFPTRTVQMREVKAFILSSFGFGQKGGQVIGVAPKYFLATLQRGAYEEYSTKCHRRKQVAERKWVKAIMANQVVGVQTHPPYDESIASQILLDPLARISRDEVTGSYRFNSQDVRNLAGRSTRQTTKPCVGFDREKEAMEKVGTEKELVHARTWIEEQSWHAPSNHSRTVGIDMVQLKSFTAFENPLFLERNYTDRERAYISRSLDARSTVASRWAAKEAVFKCLKTPSKGAGAAMKDIEVVSDGEIPRVALRGDAVAAAQKTGLEDIQLSVSYEHDAVVAIALGIVGGGAPTYLAY